MLYTFQALYIHQLINPQSNITFPLENWETKAQGWEEFARRQGWWSWCWHHECHQGSHWGPSPAALSWLCCAHMKPSQCHLEGPGKTPQWDLSSSRFRKQELGKSPVLRRAREASQWGLPAHVHCCAFVRRWAEQWPGTRNKTSDQWDLPLDTYVWERAFCISCSSF